MSALKVIAWMHFGRAEARPTVIRILLFTLLLFVLNPIGLFSQSTPVPRYWIFFKDRGITVTNPNSIDPKSLGITQRAMKRRAKVLPADKLIDERDLPVAQAYLHQLRNRGLTIHVTSRWLNAVSVSGSLEQIQSLTQLPFVQNVDVVASIKPPEVEVSAIPVRTPLLKSQQSTTLNYGPSITQLANIKVPEVHDLGIFGNGVLVGMIDDGFNNHKTHEALKNIPVLTEYDWIQADTNTSREGNDALSQGDHGASTMSVLAGFQSGKLIGPAFGATLILAKSEFDPTETQIELDNYVKALEWMEQLGADVVSTSLGYDDLDPYRQYNLGDIVYSMKNGNTAVTSRAARVAASKGVLLVTAVGNEYWWRFDDNWRVVNGQTGSLVTPADADSIVAVGAIDPTGKLAGFSSTGPTTDGRIKPEVVAQGTDIVAADGATTGGYWGITRSTAQGTSFSTPLTAGVAALVVSAHPELTPMQVREALTLTAVHINDTDPVKNITSWPNNWYGYGMVNAIEAILYHGLVFSNRPVVTSTDTSFTIRIWIKSKNTLTADSLALYFKHPADAAFTRVLLSPSGSADQYFVHVSRSLVDSASVGYFSASDNSGKSRKAPYNAPDSLFSLAPTPDSILRVYPPPSDIPQEFFLHANFPNPFNGSTNIWFDVPQTAEVKLEVYNILGQRIRTLFNGTAQTGTSVARWDGHDESGNVVSSGMYFYRLTTPSSALTKKMLYIR